MKKAYCTPRVETRTLKDAHRTELERSGIDPDIALLGGVSSISFREAYELGIRGDHGQGGLVYRYWDPRPQRFSDRFVRVKPDTQLQGRKYLQPVGEMPRLYFVAFTPTAVLDDISVPILLTEGEKKTLALDRALHETGICGLVIGIGGVWSWRCSPKEIQPEGKLGRGRSKPITDLELVRWAGRGVFLFFDSDAGTNWKVGAAEIALARELAGRGATVHIVRLTGQGKVGIDDLLAAHGSAMLPKLIEAAWRFDGHPYPEAVHLSDIEDARLGRRRVAMNLMVSAIGEAFLLPKVIDLCCAPIEPAKKKKPHLRIVRDDHDDDLSEDELDTDTTCSHCGLEGGEWQYEIRDPRILIDFTRLSFSSMEKRLQVIARRACLNATYRRTRSHQTVTSFLGSPKTRRLRAVTTGTAIEVIDESGKPYREKVLYFGGRLDEAAESFRAIGVALPSPKTQEATAYFWRLDPLADEFDSFVVSREIAREFAKLQAAPEAALEKLKAIAKDVTDHITNIYGAHRELSILGKLLVYHSIIRFEFDGEMVNRGWLQMVEIGDTGQGKTQQVDRLIQATGMGESVDGVSTSRTGLAYSFQKFNDSWFLVWGRFPLNDRRLLFVDEAQNLQPDDLDKIRKGRSDGVISADGVRSGEHATRTRLIASCNPRFQGVVDDHLFGVDLVKETFKDEDVRRFDFAIISSSSDKKGDINTKRAPREQHAQLIPAAVLSASVKWAWSRRPEHVVFTHDAVDAVYAAATTLVGLYGDARDIPLVLDSDVRHKVARLAVAAACLLHSTDDAHDKVLVTPEHVAAVADFLVEVYNNANCAFNVYAKIRRSESAFTDEDYEAIWQALRDCRVDGTTVLREEDLSIVLRMFLTHGGLVGRQDLAGELGKSAEWTSKIVRVLKDERLIRVNRGRAGGYRATPRFTKFLKLAVAKKDVLP